MGVYSDTTQLNSTSGCRHVHSVNNCHLSMNVVTQLTQFVGRDIINKNMTDLLFNRVSLVELYRYKHPFRLLHRICLHYMPLIHKTFCHPCQSRLDSPPRLLVSSYLSSSPLSSSITPLYLHSMLKTYLFNKSFPP